MAKTFLQLTNEVLRANNQVELTSANFDTARGVHSWAKDGVNMAIRQINTEHYKWPFNAAVGSQVLTAGVYEYDLPAVFKTVDWESFQIEGDDALSVSYENLSVMDRNEWYERWRDADDRAVADDGIGVPKYVIRTHDWKFALSPNPDQAYTVLFNYYNYSTELTDWDDETTIPDQFAHVIVLGAGYHFARMMDGLTYSQDLGNDFKKSLAQMRAILINDEAYMRDYRVKF